jgi:hypothetical protein
MNPIVRRVLGESVEAKPLVRSSKPQDILVCPHCQKEVLEKHTYCENGVDYHSDCGGAIAFPKPDPASIPAWLKPYMP